MVEQIQSFTEDFRMRGAERRFRNKVVASQHDINKPQRDGMQLYSSDEYYNLLSTWPTYKQTAVGAGLYLSLINDDADARDD